MQINHPAERRIEDQPVSVHCYAGAHRDRHGLTTRFYCLNSGNSASTAATNDNRVGVSDDGRVAQGSSVQTEEGSVGVSGSGNATAPGGLALTGSNVRDVNISSSDPVTLKAAIDAVSKLAAGYGTNLGQVLQTVSDNQADASSATNQTLSQVLSEINTLAKSSQTQGESLRNNTVLSAVLGLGVLGSIVAVFALRRK